MCDLSKVTKFYSFLEIFLLKKSKCVFMGIWGGGSTMISRDIAVKVKLATTIGSLWKAQTKIAKKDYLTKNLSSPTYLKLKPQIFRFFFLSFCHKIVSF